MEILDRRVPTGEWTLRLTSDWQIGSVTTSTRVIDRVMEPVYERSDYRVAFLGDLWDHITVHDRRFSWEDLDGGAPTPLDQVRTVANYIRPALDKVLSIGEGNHELVAAKDIGNLTKHLCGEMLHRPELYGGYSCIMRLNKQDQILLWHGRPSMTARAGGPMARRAAIKRRLVATNRDRWNELPGKGAIKLFAQGHVNHLEVVSPDESKQMHLSVDWDAPQGKRIQNEYVNADAAWYAVCGSAQRLFVEGKTSYAEAAGYSPISLGCVDVHFKSGRIVDVEAIPMG